MTEALLSAVGRDVDVLDDGFDSLGFESLVCKLNLFKTYSNFFRCSGLILLLGLLALLGLPCPADADVVVRGELLVAGAAAGEAVDVGGGGADVFLVGPRGRSNVVPPGGCFRGGMAGGRSSSPHDGVRLPEEDDDQTFSCD